MGAGLAMSGFLSIGKGLTLLVLLGVLGGCSSTSAPDLKSPEDPSDLRLLWNGVTAAWQSWKTRNDGPPPDPRGTLTAELVDASEYPAILVETTNPTEYGVFATFPERNGRLQWRSPEKQGITTEAGFVVSTYGLGFDLFDSDVTGSKAALFGEGPRQGYSRIHRQLDSEIQPQAITYTCHLLPLGKEQVVLAQRAYDTDVWEERCQNADETFKNQYWIDRGSAKMRISDEWLPIRGGRRLRLERLTP